MTRDFSIDKYQDLCAAIKHSGYECWTMAFSMESNILPENLVLLRHDVDRKPNNALRLAEIERNLGLHSTYYFRMTNGSFHPSIIQEIAKMGHEIGFHYECLSKTKGNYSEAINLFERELLKFRQLASIRSIAMHGSPFSPFDNRDLWKNYNFRDFGIAGEAYLSIDYSLFAYITDTGRSWQDNKFNLRDKVNISHSNLNSISRTDDLIDAFNRKTFNRICIQTHPERWSGNDIEWGLSYITDFSANWIKWFINRLRSK